LHICIVVCIFVSLFDVCPCLTDRSVELVVTGKSLHDDVLNGGHFLRTSDNCSQRSGSIHGTVQLVSSLTRLTQ